MNFKYADLAAMTKKYDPARLKDGFNSVARRGGLLHLQPGAGALGLQGALCEVVRQTGQEPRTQYKGA